MAELSRSEKLAAAQLKLKKFRESKGGGHTVSENAFKGSVPQSTVAAYFNTPANVNESIPSSTPDPFHFVPLDSHTSSTQENGIHDPTLKPNSLAEYFGATPGDKQYPSSGFPPPETSFFIPGSELAYTETANPPKTDTPGDLLRVQCGNVDPGSGTDFFTPQLYPAPPQTIPQPSFDQSVGICPNTDEVGQDSLNASALANVQVDGTVYNEPEEPVGNIPTATTEKILQLSQQLNGILQTSEQLTTSFTSSAGGFSSSYQLGETELPGSYSTSQPDVSGQCIDMNGFSTGPHSPYSGTLDRPTYKRSNTPMSTHSATAGNSYVRDLEERNVELASLLEKRSRAHERAMAKLSALQEQYAKATSQAVAERISMEQSASRDLARSQEQIRAHAQTIGVLVAEKTELQTKVSHLERLANERSHEIELIDDRLQNYRKQSVESERSVMTLKSNLEKANQETAELTTQLERYKSDIKRERTSRENVEAELQEAYSRLNNREHEVRQLELNVTELRRQLELLQVYANQLAVTGDPDSIHSTDGGSEAVVGPRPSREDWLAERTNLIQRIEELENTALQASKDSGRLESQYKTLVSQVEQQAGDLRSQLSDANASNQQLQLCLEDARRALREKEDELVEYKSKLENVPHQSAPPVSTLNEDKPQTGTTVSMDEVNRLKELEELTSTQQQDLQRLTEEMVSLKSKLVDAESVIHEKDMLLADRDSVLATATSERTALSRAMEQNRTLKQQLTELQDAFVSMSNQNMQLTTDLQREQHALRESGTIQHDYRGQLERLQEHCARREAEYNALSEAFEALSRELDRAREQHQECEHVTHTGVVQLEPSQQQNEGLEVEHHDDVVAKLMQELETSQTTITNLETRLELFESALHRIQVSFEWLQEQAAPQENGVASRTALTRNKDKRDLNDNPLELVASWDRLALTVIAQKDREVAVQAEQNRQHQATLQQLPSVEEWNKLQLAHTQLENKFVDCMDRLSRVTEDHAKLETVVAQLEMEAATVGEYVTLFAHRRAAAARRAQAREHLLSRLMKDRMRLRSRLHHMRAMFPTKPDGENPDPTVSVETELNKDELRQTDFLSEFQNLLEEINITADEAEAEAGLSLLSDEDVEEQSSNGQPPSEQRENSPERQIRSNQTLEQLRQQALQHDCPHCQCCVGTLLEV